MRTMPRASLSSACVRARRRTATARATPTPDLVGQWRAKLQFTSGAFAPVKDLEFMYVFNLGGTMTESSNYDAVAAGAAGLRNLAEGRTQGVRGQVRVLRDQGAGGLR